MITRKLAGAFGFVSGVWLLGAVHTTGVVLADELPSASCNERAAEWGRKADEYDAAAARYRAWARAEGMFGTDRNSSEWDLSKQAERLASAAEQSRSRAAEACPTS